EPTGGLARPALPPALRRVAPAVLAVEPEPDTLEPQPAVPVPAVEPFDVPELRRASAAEVVLPVPPPAPTPPKRKGRRLRRQAA
ncbi:MAG: hypothetical protein JWO76_1440, partial [Nocardioides sp.]|nr:hypothetical protein [Nocardioides sp.]